MQNNGWESMSWSPEYRNLLQVVFQEVTAVPHSMLPSVYWHRRAFQLFFRHRDRDDAVDYFPFS